MRGLKICLWVSGVMFLLGGIGLFLPDPTWVCIVEFFGVESTALTDSPLAEYMLRAGLAMCFMIGVFLIALGLRPVKYAGLIPFSGLAILLLGLACAVSGVVAGMPVMWILGDSLSCLILGALILVFWKMAKPKHAAE